MAGGWATALGAAILSGNQGYQERRAQDAQLKLQALNAAILGHQAQDIPRQQAQQKLDAALKMYGEQAYDMPEVVELAKQAGVPMKQVDPNDLTRIRVNAIESGAGAPSQRDVSDALGVTPDTNVELPPDVLVARATRALNLRKLGAETNFFENPGAFLGVGSQPPAAPAPQPGVTPSTFGQQATAPAPAPQATDDPTLPNGVKSYLTQLKGKYDDPQGAAAELQQAWPSIQQAHPNVDPKKVITALGSLYPQPSAGSSQPGTSSYDPADVNRRLGLKMFLGVDPTSVLGPVQKTPEQIKTQTNAEVAAKPLSADSQKAVNALLEWGPHYRGVVNLLQQQGMYNPDNPQQGNGWMDLGKNVVRRGEYALGINPPDPYKTLIQETEMSNANLLGPLLHGIRNPEVINMLRQHLANTMGTPAEMGDRATAILAAIPQRIRDIYLSEHKTVPPEVMARAQQLTKGLKVNPVLLNALGGDATGMQPTAAPQQQRAASVPLSKAIAVARINKLDPKQYIAQLKAEGVNVIQDQQ